MTVAQPRPTPAELDELTLARARRGDQAAARALFDHYHRQVFAFLWRMLTPHATQAAIEDLTQDTFLRAFVALPRFASDGPARLSSWLLTIATRVALNELRRKRRRPDPTLDVDLVAVAGGARPDDAANRRAVGAIIARAIGELPADFRAVLVLREYHDQSLDEIARALEIPVGTVQSRLARARAALRGALEGVR